MSSIRIGPFDYAVDIVEDLKDDDGTRLYGEIIYSTRRIRIKPDQEKDQRLATLWHETLHAILEHAGMKYRKRERLVKVLANGVAQVLRDNPDIRGADCG